MPESITSARSVLRKMKSMANETRAAGSRRFFRTGVGQYGEGDRFLGITVPEIRALERACRSLSLGEIEVLLESPWHEARLLALAVLAGRYAKATPREQDAIYRLYLRRADRINNWDLVDVSAPHIVGAHLYRRSRAPLRRLARSRSLWKRRIAMVATHSFIRRGDFDDALDIARLLLRDRHDLIHKAMGWMLREIGKKDERVLLDFLDAHAHELPRTALRYSLERLSPRQRAHYMAIRRS